MSKPRMRSIDGHWVFVSQALIPDPINRVLLLGVILGQQGIERIASIDHPLGAQYLGEALQLEAGVLDAVLSLLTKGTMRGVMEANFQRKIRPLIEARRQALFDAFRAESKVRARGRKR